MYSSLTSLSLRYLSRNRVAYAESKPPTDDEETARARDFYHILMHSSILPQDVRRLLHNVRECERMKERDDRLRKEVEQPSVASGLTVSNGREDLYASVTVLCDKYSSLLIETRLEEYIKLYHTNCLQVQIPRYY